MNTPDTNTPKGYDVPAGEGERTWIVGDTMDVQGDRCELRWKPHAG